MNAQHTPGPWRTSAKFEPYQPAPTVYSEKGQQIAVCRDAGCVCFTAQDVANARLIAAAPELLDALELALVTLVRVKPPKPHDSTQGTRDVINAAIAKAKRHA